MQTYLSHLGLETGSPQHPRAHEGEAEQGCVCWVGRGVALDALGRDFVSLTWLSRASGTYLTPVSGGREPGVGCGLRDLPQGPVLGAEQETHWDFWGRTESTDACLPLTDGHTWPRVSWARGEGRKKRLVELCAQVIPSLGHRALTELLLLVWRLHGHIKQVDSQVSALTFPRRKAAGSYKEAGTGNWEGECLGDEGGAVIRREGWWR